MTAALVEEQRVTQRQQGTVEKAPAVWNKRAKGMVMPKPREVGAAQATQGVGTGAKGQGGYLFHCTRQTGAECLERMLFGAPGKDMQGMKEQIKVGSTVFLYNTSTRAVMGPYTATSEPGLWLEKDAWKASDRKFAAQVRVQAHGTVRRWPLARGATALTSGVLTEQDVRRGKQSQGGGRVMEARKGSPCSRAKPMQEQGGQGRCIKWHDCKVHEIPKPKAADPQQLKGVGQGGTQQADKPKLKPEPGQQTPTPRAGVMQGWQPQGVQAVWPGSGSSKHSGRAQLAKEVGIKELPGEAEGQSSVFHSKRMQRPKGQWHAQRHRWESTC